MTAAALLLALALPAAAGELGGHDLPKTAAQQEAPEDQRRATLEELWQRRILPPDQDAWSPADMELLRRIRASEDDALRYFRRRFGGYRRWTARPRTGTGASLLTKDGYERYLSLVSQDAIKYFEAKGAETQAVFKLKDWDGKPVFDAAGLLTESGARLYGRARLNLEAYWRGPDGTSYGTRRPPTKKP